MTYQDTIEWMFSKLPMYQRQGKAAYKADLTNIKLLTKHLKNPQSNLNCIHVAGTNGKGSTCHMIASILQESGLKVGLFTSPHLKDFRERIKINGTCINESYVVEFIQQNKLFIENNTLSFFEITTGLAFDFFKDEKVDIAVIEVGLGGRLDSTNIITPLISVITNIGLDHTQFLGETLEEISVEKAGIIKPKIPVVIGETQKETENIFRDIAQQNNSEISFADKNDIKEYTTDLLGQYQKKNINTTIETIIQLNKLGYNISDKEIESGLCNVVKNTGLLGRWQVLNNNPKVICDTAHNREGLSLTMNQLSQESFDKLHIVLGFVNDKDLSNIIHLFPKKARYYFCKPNVPRGMKAEDVKAYFNTFEFKGDCFNSVKSAYNSAIENANDTDVIYVGGSTFVVAEII